MVWLVWQNWCLLWNVNLTFPAEFKAFVQVWLNQPIKLSQKHVWKMALFVFVWSIWISRNAVVFENKNWEPKQVFDSALLLLGHWCRSKWPEACLSTLDFVRCPTALVLDKGCKQSALANLCDLLFAHGWVGEEGNEGEKGVGGGCR
ncbi:hypothetical protein GQ457_14G009290 [Hibiscus cannabinus]